MNEIIDERMLQINNETLIGWIVWVNDGINDTIIYNSKQHSWLDIPKVGVQYMYRVYDKYMEHVSGLDFYCPYQLYFFDDDISKWIKYGIMIDEKKLMEIFEEMRSFKYKDFLNI